MSNVGAGQTQDYLFGPRGGILLDILLTLRPRAFYNIGTTSEQVVPSSMIVTVGDSATAASVVGQDTTGFVIVSTDSPWGWGHPNRANIIEAASVIEKLAFNTFTPMPIGVLRGSLRIIAGWDPLRQVSHDLVVEASLLVFDQNIT